MLIVTLRTLRIGLMPDGFPVNYKSKLA